MSEKVAEMLYANKKKVHNTKNDEEVFIFLHQTHIGDPHTNTFSASVYPLPESVDDQKLLLVELIGRKRNLSGYTRVIRGKFVD